EEASERCGGIATAPNRTSGKRTHPRFVRNRCISAPRFRPVGLRADRAPDAALIGPTCETDAVPTRAIDLTGPLDLRATLGIHLRGTGDLTMRLGADAVIRSTRTPDGPATIRIAAGGVRLEAEAWGPGA